MVDRLLDASVVGGFTSVGYGIRARSWAELPPDALAGRTVLVTGANSGIGLSASEGLASLGAHVRMLVRDRGRGSAARAGVVERLADRGIEDAGERLQLEICDVSDLERVRAFAEDFGERVGTLHGLVHNAGALTQTRMRSAQGHELTLATHVLGPFLLTELLLPALRRGAPSQVLFVASGGMYTVRLDADDLGLEHREFDGPRFYAHAKRIQVILAELLAKRELGSGVSFASVHPGWADTPGVAKSLPRFHRVLGPLLRSPDQGADTIVWLLASGAEISGEFWHDRRPRPKHRLPGTRERPEDREHLWRQLTELTGTGRTGPGTT